MRTCHDGDCTVQARPHGNRVEEGICICGYTFHNRGKEYTPHMRGHDSDCTVFNKLSNHRKDGLCTCGYGHQRAGRGDWSQMYSNQLKLMLIERGHPKIYEEIRRRIMQQNPGATDKDILDALDARLDKESGKELDKIFGGKNERRKNKH